MEAIAERLESRSDVTRQAVADRGPGADFTVRSRSTDVRRIERTLEGLLDFCFDPEALILHNRLCRHDLLQKLPERW